LKVAFRTPFHIKNYSKHFAIAISILITQLTISFQNIFDFCDDAAGKFRDIKQSVTDLKANYESLLIENGALDRDIRILKNEKMTLQEKVAAMKTELEKTQEQELPL
jgi:regulator of replication initiation timing